MARTLRTAKEEELSRNQKLMSGDASRPVTDSQRVFIGKKAVEPLLDKITDPTVQNHARRAFITLFDALERNVENE